METGTIIQGIVGIILAWFTYNQYTKNKMTDLKIENIQQNNRENSLKNSRIIAIVFGELWKLLHDINADRCFIVQPDPLGRIMYISVIYEVDKSGISIAKDDLQNIPYSEVGDFVDEISTNCWLEYTPDNEVKNGKIRSLRKMRGTNYSRLKQLVNIKGEWIGSLIVENNTKDFPSDVKDKMKITANTIQYILPPIN